MNADINVQVLVDKVRSMARAASTMRKECHLIDDCPELYYPMIQAVWDFCDHTDIPETLWENVREVCPWAFKADSFDLHSLSHFTRY